MCTFIFFWVYKFGDQRLTVEASGTLKQIGTPQRRNSVRKPNHTALIILNASNTDLHSYVTVELTSSAKEPVVGQYTGVRWCWCYLPEAVRAAPTRRAQLYLERPNVKWQGRQPGRGLVDLQVLKGGFFFSFLKLPAETVSHFRRGF